MGSWLWSVLAKVATMERLGTFLQSQAVNKPGPTKADRVQAMEEAFASGVITRQQLAQFFNASVRAGSKHVYLYNLDRGTYEHLFDQQIEDTHNDLILEAHLPNQTLLVDRLIRRGVDGKVETIQTTYVQTVTVKRADYVTDHVDSELINYYVVTELDLQRAWLTVWLEPTQNLRVAGAANSRAPFHLIADQYVARMRHEFGFACHMEPDLYQGALFLLWLDATRREHPSVEQGLAQLAPLTQSYLAHCQGMLQLQPRYVATVKEQLESAWELALISPLLDDGTNPNTPTAVGIVRRQRNSNRDGTVVDTLTTNQYIELSHAYYGTKPLILRQRRMERLTFLWKMPSADRMVNTVLEAVSRPHVSFLTHSTSEEEIRYVLSGLGEYCERANPPAPTS